MTSAEIIKYEWNADKTKVTSWEDLIEEQKLEYAYNLGWQAGACFIRCCYKSWGEEQDERA